MIAAILGSIVVLSLTGWFVLKGLTSAHQGPLQPTVTVITPPAQAGGAITTSRFTVMKTVLTQKSVIGGFLGLLALVLLIFFWSTIAGFVASQIAPTPPAVETVAQHLDQSGSKAPIPSNDQTRANDASPTITTAKVINWGKNNWGLLITCVVLVLLAAVARKTVFSVLLFLGFILMMGYLFLGQDRVERFGKNVLTSIQTASDKSLATGKPLTPTEQEAKHQAELTVAKRAAEVKAAQAAVEAEASVKAAAVNAKAAEAARLTEEISRHLPTSIEVPDCKFGMSEPVILPAHWGVMAAWGVGSTPFDTLKDGKWTRATTINNENVEAMRFCTISQANADISNMPLSWYPN